MSIVDVPFDFSLGIPVIPDDVRRRIRAGERVKIRVNAGSGFVKNALQHGVAGLWIDGGRIGWQSDADKMAGRPASFAKAHPGFEGKSFAIADRSHRDPAAEQHTKGRWPSNVILSEEAAEELDRQTGVTKSTGGDGSGFRSSMLGLHENRPIKTGKNGLGFGDSGGASRFFYVAKPSRAERDAGLAGLVQQVDGTAVTGRNKGDTGSAKYSAYAGTTETARRNTHPTTKPLTLMRHLVRLTKTPTGGLVLDPFAGSGTTGMACVCEGRPFLGIDLEPEYVEIAKLRIAHVEKHGPKWDVDPRQVTLGETGQADLFDKE